MDRKRISKDTSLENMEESLYNPSTPDTTFRRGVLHKDNVNVSREWTHENPPEDDLPEISKTGFLKKFFLSSLVFFIIAVGFGVYQFFLKGKINPEENIEMSVVGSTFSQAGEDLPLTVDIVNKNDFSLELVDLIVESPKNGQDPTASLEDTDRVRIPLGDISPNKNIIKEIPVILYGKEGDTRNILFTLEYHIENSSAIFQKQKTYTVALSSSPITARIDAYETAVPKQDYVLKVQITPNTTKQLQNVLLVVDYPTGFQYKSASLEPLSLNNMWDLGTLDPGQTKEVQITGAFLGQEGEEKSFRALIGTYSSSNAKKIATNLGTLIHTTLLQKPFLSTELVINGEPVDKPTILPGSQIQGEVFWKNNTPNKILDAEIQVRLKGDLFDRAMAQPIDGFYNSQIDAFVWNKNTIKDFTEIPVGASGTFQFTIPSIAPKADGSMKNPNVAFEIFSKGLEDIGGSTPKKIESIDSIVVRILADTNISQATLFSTGPLANNGPFPPQINKETTYTLAFYVKNSTNDITQAELRGRLPANVTFTGNFSPESEKVVVDEKTGELIWKIGNVSQSTNPIAKSTFIQVKAIPSLVQVGERIPLLTDIVFKAVDRFTGKSLNQDMPDLTSQTLRTEGEDQGDNAGTVIN